MKIELWWKWGNIKGKVTKKMVGVCLGKEWNKVESNQLFIGYFYRLKPCYIPLLNYMDARNVG